MRESEEIMENDRINTFENGEFARNKKNMKFYCLGILEDQRRNWAKLR